MSGTLKGWIQEAQQLSESRDLLLQIQKLSNSSPLMDKFVVDSSIILENRAQSCSTIRKPALGVFPLKSSGTFLFEGLTTEPNYFYTSWKNCSYDSTYKRLSPPLPLFS